MSYDVSLEIDTGSRAVEVTWRNMTSNVARMWRHAGADLAEFDGKPAADMLPVLRQAIDAMEADPDTYRAMNPPNGWGDYESYLEFLRGLASDFGTHPKTTIRVCR